MTTNSPNPFDGDVRAHQMPAMTDSERQKNIDAIYTRMRSIAEEGDENLQFEYGILRFALVALTTPPAQLLRQVELPEAKDKSQGWKIDPDYLCRIAEHIGESEEHGAAPCLEHIEAVLLAVNEVKS